MLRRALSSSPRMTTMSSAPMSGRKVTRERIGQPVMSILLRRKHDVSDQCGDADQHGEGVMVEVARLQPHDPVGDVDHPGRNAVRAEAVDQPAVSLFPQETPEPLRRADE